MTRVHSSLLSSEGHAHQILNTDYNNASEWEGRDYSTHREALAVCYDFYDFFDRYGDRTVPIYSRPQKLTLPFAQLPARVQL